MLDMRASISLLKAGRSVPTERSSVALQNDCQRIATRSVALLGNQCWYVRNIEWSSVWSNEIDMVIPGVRPQTIEFGCRWNTNCQVSLSRLATYHSGPHPLCRLKSQHQRWLSAYESPAVFVVGGDGGSGGPDLK